MSILLPRFYRHTAELAREAVDHAVREARDDSQQIPRFAHTKPGDWRLLRGVPIIADGIGGTQLGSDPLGAWLRKEASGEHTA